MLLTQTHWEFLTYSTWDPFKQNLAFDNVHDLLERNKTCNKLYYNWLVKRLPEIFHKICRDFLHDYFRYRTSGYTNYGNLERQKQSIKILQLTSTRAFSSFRSWFKPNFECTKLIKVWVNGRHRYLKPQISFSFLLIIVVSQSSVRSFLAFNYWSYKTDSCRSVAFRS